VVGEWMEKGYRKVNMVQILYTHRCKWKMIPVETNPEMVEGGERNTVEGMNSSMIFDILQELFVNATMYRTQHSNKKKRMDK
jgi:hypothetical protein